MWQVAKIRTITTKMNSLMQAGIADDALPVLTQSGSADTLWIPEIERFAMSVVFKFTNNLLCQVITVELRCKLR